MAFYLKYTGSETEKILDSRLHSFIQDVHDTEHTSGSPQSITADTPVMFTNNGGLPIRVVAPSHITSRWDATNNKIAFPEELNTPTYVAEVGFTFDPSIASEGLIFLRMYIDDDTPKLIKTYSAKYKSVAQPQTIIATWYLGEDTGYDAKNDGIYFELEFQSSGDLYDKTLIIYRT